MWTSAFNEQWCLCWFQLHNGVYGLGGWPEEVRRSFNDKWEGLLSGVVVFLCQNGEFHDLVKQNGEHH